MKHDLGLQRNFRYSRKVRIEEEVFRAILFQDLQALYQSVGPLDLNLGLLGDFGQDPYQPQLPPYAKETLWASFMERSETH